MMDAMNALEPGRRWGVGERDLRFGLAYLRQEVARTQAPVVSANLYDKAGRKPIFPPYRNRSRVE